MPALDSHSTTVAIDVRGCPARCRHCWLYATPNGRVAEQEVRWVADQFRTWSHLDHAGPWFTGLTVQTWYREPDFAPEYSELYELERELSDGDPVRYELLSVWRLPRDDAYAPWARDVGTEICQLTFFGMEETTDWFVRRRGAFRDTVVATERLLSACILPRWQLFLTTRILPELGGLVDLAHDLRLDERCRDLGAEFDMFLHTPGPDGEACDIENLRPEAEDLHPLDGRIPDYLVEKTMRHFDRDSADHLFGHAESELVEEMRHRAEPWGAIPSTGVQFMVTHEFDVYSNVAEPAPWWCLGNLRTDGIDYVIRRFEADAPPGHRAQFHTPLGELVERYGHPDSRLVYDEADLATRVIRQAAMAEQARLGEPLKHTSR